MLAICPPWGVTNPPLGLAYLAEALGAEGLTVELFDLNVRLYQQVNGTDQHLWETKNDAFWREPKNVSRLLAKWNVQVRELVDQIIKSASPVIGFSIVDPNEHFSSHILRLLKEKAPHKILIVGGPGCAGAGQRRMLMDNSNNGLDYFLIGESEQSLPKLIQALKNNQQQIGIENLVHARKSLEFDQPIIRPSLDTLSYPTFQDFNLDLYGGNSLAIMWSRGCIGHCSYCKERALLGPYRMRSTENILAELQHHIFVLGLTNFVLYDSTINGKPSQLAEICDEICRLKKKITWSAEAIALPSMTSDLLKKMRLAGCHTLIYGIESGSDNVLSSMGKLFNTKTAAEVLRRTHKAGIKVAINILVGFPGENNDDFMQTIHFLKQNSKWIDRLDGVSTLQIVDGTPLKTRITQLGIHLPDTDPHDKWQILDSNTYEIRQKRLVKVLETADMEGFEVGRTFSNDPPLPQQSADKPEKAPPAFSPLVHSTDGEKTVHRPTPVFPVKSSPLTSYTISPKQQSKNGQTKKILLATCQPLPAADKPTTGGSLRAYHLGKALEECGHQVLYSLPDTCLTTETEKAQWQNLAHNGFNIKTIAQKAEAEVVLFCNWGLAGANTGCDIPAIIDMNGSLILENYYRQHSLFFHDAMTKLDAIASTDYIIAGSETQKSYLTSWCLMAGMHPDAINIGVIPFSLSPDPPHFKDNPTIQFILAGYDWPWLNGNKQILAICDELERHEKGTIQLYTSTPPYSDVLDETSYMNETGELRSIDLARLIRREPLPFSQLSHRLVESSVAIDIWQKNAERELAFPSRAVAYLWAGLPVITGPDGELAKLIQQYNAGWLVDSNDLKHLRELTSDIVSGKVNLDGYRKNARKLFNDHLRRDKTIAELDYFCRNPFLNRNISPFVKKYDFLKNLTGRLQGQLKHNEEVFQLEKRMLTGNLENKNRECQLMGMIHRRPKGFAVYLSWSMIKHKMRRLVIGIPVLFYLTGLTLFGHFLHTIWTRRNRA